LATFLKELHHFIFLLQQLVGKTTNSKKTRKQKPPGLEEINFHKTRSNKNQELQQTIIK
jgi:hypothetical protein